jgi:hypothetical protein
MLAARLDKVEKVGSETDAMGMLRELEIDKALYALHFERI